MPGPEVRNGKLREFDPEAMQVSQMIDYLGLIGRLEPDQWDALREGIPTDPNLIREARKFFEEVIGFVADNVGHKQSEYFKRRIFGDLNSPNGTPPVNLEFEKTIIAEIRGDEVLLKRASEFRFRPQANNIPGFSRC